MSHRGRGGLPVRLPVLRGQTLISHLSFMRQRDQFIHSYTSQRQISWWKVGPLIGVMRGNWEPCPGEQAHSPGSGSQF